MPENGSAQAAGRRTPGMITGAEPITVGRFERTGAARPGTEPLGHSRESC
jgi:hypothetical protein